MTPSGTRPLGVVSKAGVATPALAVSIRGGSWEGEENGIFPLPSVLSLFSTFSLHEQRENGASPLLNVRLPPRKQKTDRQNKICACRRLCQRGVLFSLPLSQMRPLASPCVPLRPPHIVRFNLTFCFFYAIMIIGWRKAKKLFAAQLCCAAKQPGCFALYSLQ